MILKEIKSLKTSCNFGNEKFLGAKKKEPYIHKMFNLPKDVLGQDAVDFLSKRKAEFACGCDSFTKCLTCFKGNVEKYIYNQQNIASQVLRDFCEKIDMSKPNATLNFDYQADQIEK